MIEQTMIAKTVDEAVRSVMDSQPDATERDARGLKLGQVAHQGDVYLHLVESDHPRGKELGTRQVAVGTTVGSRHIASGSQVTVYEGVKLPAWVKTPSWCRDGDVLGPVVVAKEEFVLTHPEHAHAACAKDVTIQVTYQADYSTRQRVQD